MAWEFELLDNIETAAQVKASWGSPPENSDFPLVTLNLVSEPVFYTLSGHIEVRRATVQIDVWGLSYVSAWEVRKRIEAYLLTNMSGLEYEDVSILTIRNGSTPANDEAFRQSMDVRVFFRA